MVKFRFSPGRRSDRRTPGRDDPLFTDRAGRSALHYAVTDDPVGLNYTAALGDPDLQAENFRIGNTFRIDNTLRLLGLGADPNASDNVGLTPLHVAAQRDSVDVVNVLLAAGSHANAVTHDGTTPISTAVRNTTGARVAIVTTLLAHGADPTVGRGVMRFIAVTGDQQLASVLAEYGYH